MVAGLSSRCNGWSKQRQQQQEWVPAPDPGDLLLCAPGAAAGRPEGSGISLEIIEKLGPEGFPIFGVCMGHQCIGQVGRLG